MCIIPVCHSINTQVHPTSYPNCGKSFGRIKGVRWQKIALARSRIASCTGCRKWAAKPSGTLSRSVLPAVRLEETRNPQRIHLDYLRPLVVKFEKKSKASKYTGFVHTLHHTFNTSRMR